MTEPSRKSDDLYERYRPTRYADVIGQPAALSVIRGWGKKLPRAVLLVGPAGTGKTTLARIMAAEAGCARHDLCEINTATVEKPLDMVRELEESKTLSPLGGDIRAWILDEFQSLSRARFAQEAFLKVFEDNASPWAHYILGTTDPRKILPTIISRCARVALGPIPDADLESLVRRVAKAEGVAVEGKVVTKLVSSAGGSARSALVELQKIAGVAGEEARLAAIESVGQERAARELIGALMPFKGEPRWTDVAAVLESIRGEDPEGVRQMLLAAARTTLIKGQKGLADRAYFIINLFQDQLWDRNSGNALLAAWCWKACNPK